MPENIEKRLKERKPVPLKVELEDIRKEEDIKRIEKDTEELREKYKNELKDFAQFNEELAKEKGKEYRFQKILIDKETNNVA